MVLWYKVYGVIVYGVMVYGVSGKFTPSKDCTCNCYINNKITTNQYILCDVYYNMRQALPVNGDEVYELLFCNLNICSKKKETEIP